MNKLERNLALALKRFIIVYSYFFDLIFYVYTKMKLNSSKLTL